MLVLNRCPRLKLVEARAFEEMPNLQTVLLNNNPALSFLSPLAFPNSSAIYEYVSCYRP